MTKGEHVCFLRGHNSIIKTGIKICFLHAYAKCIHELCSKSQILNQILKNTEGGIAEARTIPQCDMVKICISFRGYNSAIKS